VYVDPIVGFLHSVQVGYVDVLEELVTSLLRVKVSTDRKRGSLKLVTVHYHESVQSVTMSVERTCRQF
jgi:hypothetical protein